jgi:hypothetical protein
MTKISGNFPKKRPFFGVLGLIGYWVSEMDPPKFRVSRKKVPQKKVSDFSGFTNFLKKNVFFRVSALYRRVGGSNFRGFSPEIRQKNDRKFPGISPPEFPEIRGVIFENQLVTQPNRRKNGEKIPPKNPEKTGKKVTKIARFFLRNFRKKRRFLMFPRCSDL